MFEAMATQWRTGAGGAVGLDYAVIPGVAQALGIPSRRAWGLLNDVRVMEDEALLLFAEQMALDSAPANRVLH